MGNYEELKQAISNVIKQNGNEDITGEILQNVLLTIVSTIGYNSTFKGMATPETNPGTADQNIFYVATEVGVYVNFGNKTTLPYRINFLVNKNNTWSLTAVPLFPSVFDVSRYYTNTDGTNIFTFDEAIAKVSSIFRLPGIKVLYLEKSKQPRTYQYIGGTWTEKMNWKFIDVDTCFLNINQYNFAQNTSESFPFFTEEEALLSVPLSLRKAGMIVCFATAANKWYVKQYVGNRNGAPDDEWKNGFIDVYNERTYTDNVYSTESTSLLQVVQNIPIYKRRQYMPVILNINGRNVQHRMIYKKESILNDDFYNLDNWEIIESAENSVLGLGLNISGNLIKDKFIVCNPDGAGNNGTYITEVGSVSTGILYCKNTQVLFYTGFIKGNTGIAFFDENKNYIGRAEDLISLSENGIWVNNYPVKVKDGAFYCCASSRPNQIKTENYVILVSNSNNQMQFINEQIKDYYLEFDGKYSYAEFANNIVLGEDGDYLEYTSLIPDLTKQPYYNPDDAATTNCLYSLIGNIGSAGVIGSPNSRRNINMRMDDGTFITFVQGNGVFNSIIKKKYLFTATNIEYYENGLLVNSVPHNGNTFTISKMGNVYNDLFIKAYIKDIVIKSQNNIYEIGNTLNSDLIKTYSTRFVNLSDNSAIQNTYPDRYCIKTSDEIKVYYKRPDNNYICYHVYKRYMAWSQEVADAGTAPNYYDNWGIEMMTLETYNNGQFVEVLDLYRTGETELAIRIDGQAYVGGATHGYENISNDGGIRRLNIFINGVQIEELGEFQGSFDDIQINMESYLAQMQTQNNFCKANKKWIFGKDGLRLNVDISFITDGLNIVDCMTPMLLCLRKKANTQITAKAVKSNDIFKIYDISNDEWVDNPENAPLRQHDPNCQFIREWSDKYSFELLIEDAVYKSGGGMFVSTNGSVYNKIYNDMGDFTTNTNESISVKSKYNTI